MVQGGDTSEEGLLQPVRQLPNQLLLLSRLRGANTLDFKIHIIGTSLAHSGLQFYPRRTKFLSPALSSLPVRVLSSERPGEGILPWFPITGSLYFVSCVSWTSPSSASAFFVPF